MTNSVLTPEPNEGHNLTIVNHIIVVKVNSVI